jgi:hypothetical protein
MPLRISILYWASSRLVRPKVIGVLAEKMVVLLGVDHEGDFRHVNGAPGLEGCHA